MRRKHKKSRRLPQTPRNDSPYAQQEDSPLQSNLFPDTNEISPVAALNTLSSPIIPDADPTKSLLIPFPSIVTIDPNNFDIEVPYGCNLCGHLCYDIVDYVLHVKEIHPIESNGEHNNDTVIPKTELMSLTPCNFDNTEKENYARNIVDENVTTGNQDIVKQEESSPKLNKREISNSFSTKKIPSPLSKLDKIVTNLLSAKNNSAANDGDTPIKKELFRKNVKPEQDKNSDDVWPKEKPPPEAEYSKTFPKNVSITHYDCVKKLNLSQNVVSILEEAFETFPYLSQSEYESLSNITRVNIKDIETIFARARVEHGISWEPHQITQAAASLGKNGNSMFCNNNV